MKKLQLSYSRKEKLQTLITNLEKLKKDGSITEDQYISLKSEYDRHLRDSITTIETIKANLKKDLEMKGEELKALNENLETLKTRFKVGEIPFEEFQRFEERLRKRISKVRDEMSKLETLINSRSSSDVGGYLDVKIEEPRTLLGTLGETLPSRLPEVKGLEETFSRPSLFPLVCGLIILISVFLPWASASFLGLKETQAGTASGWGILSLIMGIFVIGISFLAEMRVKGIGHVTAGILAFIGVLGYWSELGNKMGMLREAVSLGFGFWLCLIGGLGAVLSGIGELRSQRR